MAEHVLTISALLPTFGRHEVLLETVRSLLALRRPPDEIVIIDQTPEHPAEVEGELVAREMQGQVRRLRQAAPSIPAALNAGLAAARSAVVLILDDDITPLGELVSAHLEAQAAWPGGIVAGQVLQPGEEPAPLEGERFSFRSSVGQEIREFMGGNVSVRRGPALELGGFDENFVGAAYRIEADFAARALGKGLRIRFEPAASVLHLRAPRGGTRAFGGHLTTARPTHSVGEYYHLLRNRPPGAWRKLLVRPWRAAVTRHHLRRPWWIPATLCAEWSGLAWAVALSARGRKLMPSGPQSGRGGS